MINFPVPVFRAEPVTAATRAVESLLPALLCALLVQPAVLGPSRGRGPALWQVVARRFALPTIRAAASFGREADHIVVAGLGACGGVHVVQGLLAPTRGRGEERRVPTGFPTTEPGRVLQNCAMKIVLT